MENEIIKSFLPDLDIPKDVSFTEVVLDNIKKHGDKVALIDAETGTKLTYKEINEQCHNLSGGLLQQGLRYGDVALIYLPNCLQYPVIFHSIISVGAIASTCNPAHKVDELGRQLMESTAKVIFTNKALLENVQKAIVNNELNIEFIVVIDGDICSNDDKVIALGQLLCDNNSQTFKPAIQSVSDVAMIPYSSGTTGMPKGVTLTHYNLLATTYQLLDDKLDIVHHDDVCAAFLPFCHIYGANVYLTFALMKGSTVVVIKEFEPMQFLKLIDQYKVTILHIVPPIAVFLTKHPIVKKYNLSSVRDITIGAAPISTELANDLKRLFNIEYIKQGYGLTELCGATLCYPPYTKAGSIGVPMANTEIKIIDLITKRALGANCQGEICVRGPQVMQGYWKNPEATKNTIDVDGWLHTGDVGYYDEDHLFYILDRIKELIKYGGSQVAPAELEGLLLTHPCVSEAAVIGKPDEEVGELPMAFVIRKPNTQCTEQDLQSFVEDNLADYKRLRGGVVFVDQIPKSRSGKILRREIKDEYLKK